MMILGIEAAARCCSAAVYEDGVILSEIRSNAGMTHSETLMPMVDQVLALSGKKVEDIELIALTKGPGSFTGLRIGGATAKGLALGLNKPLVPVGTLEALTYTGDMTESIRVGIMDARRSQVYSAAYRTVNGEEQVVLEAEARSVEALGDALAEVLEKEDKDREVVFFGDALPLYREYFQNRLGAAYKEAPEAMRELNAANVCALAFDKYTKSKEAAISGNQLTIEYLRKPQAEREREERLQREKQQEEQHG